MTKNMQARHIQQGCCQAVAQSAARRLRHKANDGQTAVRRSLLCGIALNKPLTDEQKKMLEELKTRPVQSNDDCPALTEEQLSQLVRVSEMLRDEYGKHLSTQAMHMAKLFGKAYTSVLSRILENILSDAEIIELYL